MILQNVITHHRQVFQAAEPPSEDDEKPVSEAADEDSALFFRLVFEGL